MNKIFIYIVFAFAIPMLSFAAIDISIDGNTIPLPDLSADELKDGGQTAVELWVRFNELVSKVNNWVENKAGIQFAGLLKAIAHFFVIMAKWMIALLEFLLNRV